MKKILVSLFTLIFIISMITTVYAATGSINLGASSDTVEQGKTFTVTLAGTADSNIEAFQSELSYDKSKLSIVEDGRKPGKGFYEMSGENEIIVLDSGNDTLSKSETLYTITFKVLEEAPEGETEIAVTKGLFSGMTEENSMSASTTINIKAAASAGDNKEEQENKTQTPSKNSNSGNKSNSASKSNSTTKKATKLPQTGVETVSVVAIISLAIISIVSYVSYKRYKNI